MYWHDLLKKIEDGAFDPTFILTHRFKIDEMKELYNTFDKKEYGIMKASISCNISLRILWGLTQNFCRLLSRLSGREPQPQGHPS